MSRTPEPSVAAAPTLQPWERLATDAVGTAIEFWGFKLNHGRIWALLYLRGRPMDANEIRSILRLSKGAVSMVTRELERWGVLHRVRLPGEDVWRFEAETELQKMIWRVLSERERSMVERVLSHLRAAQREAKSARATPSAAEKLDRLTSLGETVRTALEAFLATSKLDIRSLTHILAGEATRRVRRLRS